MAKKTPPEKVGQTFLSVPKVASSAPPGEPVELPEAAVGNIKAHSDKCLRVLLKAVDEIEKIITAQPPKDFKEATQLLIAIRQEISKCHQSPGEEANAVRDVLVKIQVEEVNRADIEAGLELNA